MSAIDDLRDIAVMYERQIESMRAERRMLVDALLRVEWKGCSPVPYDGCDPACPACPSGNGIQYDPEIRGYAWEHEPGCPLDAALTRAGLTTQAARDAARREMKPDTAEARDAARGGR